jgi:hypothetical protein
MTTAERSTPELAAKRKGYFLAALHELHERKPKGSYEWFALPTIAQQASRIDPDYEPRTKVDRVLGLVGLGDVHPNVRDRRESAYLGRGGEARSIIAGLVEDGQVAAANIAPMLIEEERGYGRQPNEDSKLYRLAEPPEHAISIVATEPPATATL